MNILMEMRYVRRYIGGRPASLAITRNGERAMRQPVNPRVLRSRRGPSGPSRRTPEGDNDPLVVNILKIGSSVDTPEEEDNKTWS